MSILDRFGGLVAAAAYGLQRAKLGFLRLRAGAVLTCVLITVYAGYHGWQAGFSWTHGVIMALGLAIAALLLWAGRRHYIVFQERPVAIAGKAPDLCVENKIHVRGSGTFEVSDMARYLVEVPVVFWTTQLHDHILAAHVRALNLLGVGVPSEERGWWYVFLEPKRVLRISPGQLCFGLRVRPAVRILYQTLKAQEKVYLSCDSAEQLAMVVSELDTKAQLARQPVLESRSGAAPDLAMHESA